GAIIYDDALGPGWENWSWSSNVNLDNTAPVQSGSRSIAVDYTAAWAALSFHAISPVSTASYPAVQLWVHGGSSNKSLAVCVQETETGSELCSASLTAPAGTWTEFVIPMSALGSPGQVARVNLKDNSGTDQDVFYVDNVKLLTSIPSGPTPTPTPPGPTPTPPVVSGAIIYDDALGPGWENWSWGSSVDLANTSPVYNGSRSIAVDYTNASGGLSFRTTSPVSVATYPTLKFWVHGGSSDKQLLVCVQETDSGSGHCSSTFTAPANTWTEFTVSISGLSGSPTQVARVNIQEGTSADQSAVAEFYVDDVMLLP
ncbi:MAG: hypothetical protein ACUVRU_06645, partial [Anaerolineae bacterium]